MMDDFLPQDILPCIALVVAQIRKAETLILFPIQLISTEC